MLGKRFQRGFTAERLASITEPRIQKDERGYYIMTLSENAKVHFEDFYRFLEVAAAGTAREKIHVQEMIQQTPTENLETQSYYRAKAIICDLVLKTIRRFYTDGSNFGIIMTPWCFGTVILEKIEIYRDRISRGEVQDPNIDEYPYYVVKYIDEIYKAELLALFDFPEKAFKMRWQYSELLKRYSKVLSDITGRLNFVLKTVKSFGA
ncbi:MAG: hypothetical protein JSU65_14685 [Candidatus Zixiibacteriota bacterium]|nr:MAG: hypothetical protein JSU65_14685 [candidate division Zixibacteria bacterium]